MHFIKVSSFVVLLILSFLFSFVKTADACNTTDNIKRISLVTGSCQATTCSSNVSQGFVEYLYNDNTFCTRLEYFSGSPETDGCNLDNPASNPCPASCSSKNDCTGLGVCANPDIGYFGSEQNAISSICSGTDLGPGPKACMIIGCGYQCNTSPYSCNRSYAIDSTFGTNFPGYLKPFADLQSCQVNCQAPPPIPTSLPTPPPSATPTPPPLNISCSASPTSIKTGQSTTWTATVSGGNGQYTYSWVGSEGFNTTNQTINAATVYYNIAGNKTASLTAKSGDGQTKTVSCSNSVDVITPLSLSCSAPQPASGQVETQFILSSEAKGGSGGYIYYWNIQEPNRYPRLLGGTASSAEIPWTPTTEGTTNATATVYSGSQSASCSVDFNVKGHLPSGFNPGTVTSFCAGANNPRLEVTHTRCVLTCSYRSFCGIV